MSATQQLSKDNVTHYTSGFCQWVVCQIQCMSIQSQLRNVPLFSWLSRLQATRLVQRPWVSLWRRQKIWVSTPHWHEPCALGWGPKFQPLLGASQLTCPTLFATRLLPPGLGPPLTSVLASGASESPLCDESWLWAPGQCNSPCWSWCLACRRDLTPTEVPPQEEGPLRPQEFLQNNDSRGNKLKWLAASFLSEQKQT